MKELKIFGKWNDSKFICGATSGETNVMDGWNTVMQLLKQRSGSLGDVLIWDEGSWDNNTWA